ncbi:uncharacterized protein LOC131640391 [Vicia villosa]|uniref:uncharacterized protein LOC131640391 n=1 Tax=Vicia villosa TaxID=3911 RepID=UPI00273B758E|nr:uncharacterized protein LOC131640391 [Vicia villosa]
MAPPKPPNPSPKELIEEAVQISTLHLNNAMHDTQEQMDERFAQLSSDLSNLQTRLDNDKSVEDSRYESLMAILTKISLQKELQSALTADSATVHVTAPASSTVHDTVRPSVTVHGTVSPHATVHGTASPSGTVFNPSSIPRVTAPFSHVLSPSNTPMRHSATFSTTIPQPTPLRNNYTTFPHPFPTYPPIPTVLSYSQPYTLPFSQIPPQFSQSNLSHIPPLPTLRTPKLELPMFDGSAPLDWLFQADQFFNFYNMPPENRLSLISFYMKGDALSWFKWMHQSHLLTDWFSFVKALELRFGPSSFDNHQAELFKLKQEGSVVEYQTKFEKLGTQVIGLPPDAILNCFISGLSCEIQNEMAIHKPTNISQAIGLAKLIESKLKDSKPKFQKPFSTQYSKPFSPSANPNPKPFNSVPTQAPPFRPQTVPNPTKLPIKKLTQAQIQERRAQGLCFNCDEKFFVGHKCSSSRFLILMAEDDSVCDTPLEEVNSDPEREQDLNDTYFQLSTQALTGQFAPQTLKFKGLIGGISVMVLVDTGSTHNIMQPRIAHHLNLTPTPITQFSVMVGNGSHLQCEGVCNNVPIMLQNETFKLPFYLLPIEGADVVLGMAWLRTLGPIQADFSIPSLTFSHQTNQITLKGDPNIHPSHTTFHQLKHLIHTNSVASFHLMIFQPTEPPKTTFDKPEPLFTIPPDLHPNIKSLLQKYQTIFQRPEGLPPTRPHDHHIPLFPNTPPINVKPYRYPHSQKTAMTTIIQDMLKEGIITPSHSPFSSPVLLVKKKDGTWRFCVDYRALNAVTIKDRFPIPTIDELLDELGNAKYFTKLDLRSGYHQIRVASEDTHKTAFRTFDGHYEFLVMPFGLTNAPSTFQSAMNDLLRPYLRKFVLVFFDDILIYSDNFCDHLTHLQVIFTLLESNAFVVKLSKCVFAVSQVQYLGHVISVGGVAPDPEKVQAMLDWPTPCSLTSLRGFLGLTGFYRRFVKHYATLAAPLTDLLRSSKFTWSTEAAEAFTELKTKMTDMPVLALPDFTKKFIVETDASGVAIGAVLSQDGHPIAYFSKKMCPRMQASSVYIREMFAVTEAVKKWRQYLIGQRFHIYTDQKSLRNLLLQRIQTPEQQKWASKLQGFNFEIFYKPGKSNLVADALSRKFHSEDSLLLAFSSPIPNLLDTLREFYATDRAGQILVSENTCKNDLNTPYRFSKGLLYYKDRLFIPDINQLRLSILKEYHNTPTAGHSGVKATLARVSTSFLWPGMVIAVKNLVKYCSVCQHNKYETQKKKGLLQPLPIPNQVWEEITMDFITGLPNSFGYTTIWVICDRLTKFAHFLALPSKFTAKDLAIRFSVEVARLHGTPKSIVSDRDPLFLSHFWKEFFKIQGTTLKFSTAYHPETDGQTEVVNRSVGTYLRCFTSDQPRKWFKFLHLAEYWFNTSFHTAINMTPFKALYGRDPPKIPDYVCDSVEDDALRDSLQERNNILTKLKANLKKSQIQMEKQANNKRRDFTFQTGDLVLLKLQPYRQQTVSRRTSQKLSKRFFGPYKVIQRVGEVAYLLDLPSSSKVHPVVHVSLLRPYFSNTASEGFRPLPGDAALSFDNSLVDDSQPPSMDDTRMLLPSAVTDIQDKGKNKGSEKGEQKQAEKERKYSEKGDVKQVEKELKCSKNEGTKSESVGVIEECGTTLNFPQRIVPSRAKGSSKIVSPKANTAVAAPATHHLPTRVPGPHAPEDFSLPQHAFGSRDCTLPLAFNNSNTQPAVNHTFPTTPTYPTSPHNTCLPTSPKPPHSNSPPSIQNPLFPSAPNPNLSPTPFSTRPGPNSVSCGPTSPSMNLEDKVLLDPMSIVRDRPIREKKPSILLKDFYY